MIDYLCRLAQEPFITVLASIRDYFYYFREKDFEYFQELEPLEYEDLQAIYNRHIEVLNNERSLFAADALDMLIQGSDRIPGRFMRLLKKVHHNLYGENTYTLEKTSRVFYSHFEKSPPPLKSAIMDAFQEGVVQIRQERLNDVGMTRVSPAIEANHILYPLPFNGDGYEISGVLNHALKLIDKVAKTEKK